MALRIGEADAEGFRDEERAVLRALPLLRADSAEQGLAALRAHFDAGADRGEIGQIVHAYGLYRGLHATNAVLGVEFLDESDRPLSERAGFSLVTMNDGSFRTRTDFDERD